MPLHCFNSKMVRLKGVGTILGRINQATFQFQNGAIKRHLSKEDMAEMIGFNSKMVRLKVGTDAVQQQFDA